MILEFDFATRSELRSAAYFRDSEKAYYLARSALSAARALLAEDARQDDRQNPIDAMTDIWATPLSPYSLGDGTVWGQITDESGKININKIAGSVGEPVRGALKRLFMTLNVPDSDLLVERLSVFVEKGRAQNKTKPFEHLSELHLIEGITDETFRKISPYVTVYPDDDKVNVNTAPVEVLQAFDPDNIRACAELIVRNRPYSDLSKARNACGTSAGLRDAPIKLKSEFFSVQGEGKVGDVVRRLSAVLKREGEQRVSLLFLRIE